MTKDRARFLRAAVAALSIGASFAFARRPEGGDQRSPLWRFYEGATSAVDRAVGWHRLPTPLGLVVLVGLRGVLRRRNLHDTSGQPAVDTPPVEPPRASHVTVRTIDGSYNDLDQPAMGMAGSRFGRNVPIQHTYPEPEAALLSPSPREVSRELLTRHEFQQATGANALVAAWLQFMIRDWFSHGKSPKDNPWRVHLVDDDPWPQRPMLIMRTRPDPTRPEGPSDLPPTFVNTETHWWDGSQLYGSSKEQQQLVRAGEHGKLHMRPDGLLPWPREPERNPANVPGFWVGLAMMQTLFTLEHNAICDRLRAEYPSWSDDELFERARLINAALLAKIHTVEWTPVVISHPSTRIGMRGNWWGLAGERVHKLFGRISGSEVISGIPGSATRHVGVPYALTEEFAAVYRDADSHEELVRGHRALALRCLVAPEERRLLHVAALAPEPEEQRRAGLDRQPVADDLAQPRRHGRGEVAGPDRRPGRDRSLRRRALLREVVRHRRSGRPAGAAMITGCPWNEYRPGTVSFERPSTSSV